MAVSEGTQEELERQRARWWATVSSGDLDGYLALFAEDAVWVTPELDEIVGREAIRAWLEPVFAQFDYELTITVADVRVAGTLGIERARCVSGSCPIMVDLPAWIRRNASAAATSTARRQASVSTAGGRHAYPLWRLLPVPVNTDSSVAPSL